MPVLRTRRVIAVALVLAGGAVGTALAPGAVATPAPARARVASVAVAAVQPRPAVSQAAVRPPARRVVAGARVVRTSTRLALSLTAGARPSDPWALLGLLRRGDGRRVPGRTVTVYRRIGETGTWRRAAALTTSSTGVVRLRLRRVPDLQVTLRFAGDTRYRPAASVLLVPDPTARALDPGLARALTAARAAARRAGLSLVVNSGYRTWAKQQAMYDAAVRRYGSARAARHWVLPPAESTHVRGFALDLGTPATAAWLAVRGARWDLCRPYAGEPWHFEYRPDWVAVYGGCPDPVATPGDPGPLSPRPRVPVA